MSLRFSAQFNLLLFLLCCSADALPEDAGVPSLLDVLWAQYTKASQDSPDLVSFISKCLGPSSQAQQEVFGRSFPAQWPVGADAGSFCSNATQVESRMCSEEELGIYTQFIVQTDNPEKVPSTAVCKSAEEAKGCWPGFFADQGVAMPCCDGFFCPSMLTCMIACPLGSYCTKAKPAAAPDEYNVSTENWCAPYAYKSRFGLCGGADKWTIHPAIPFPGSAWAGGSGNIYCSGGSYCPSTIGNPIACPTNSYCPVGSVSETFCPPLVRCNGDTIPVSNTKGMVLIIGVVLLLAVVWRACKLCERLKQNTVGEEAEQIRLQPYSIRVAFPEERNAAGHFGAGLLSFLRSSVQDFFHCGYHEGFNQEASTELLSFDDDTDPNMTLRADRESSSLLGDIGTLSLELVNLCVDDIRLTIEFYALSMRLKSSRKCVLSSASGVFRKSRLTAIMGPSGAGKTSLLNALAGKGGYGDVSGMILVNGIEESLEKYKPVMGFVPQDDVMHTNLTVEENLKFSARYRLSAGTSRRIIAASVERALQVLGLESVRNELIGCETTRGISGGQRKRANIGLEMVTDPLILFLDEPTSGLDSSSCRQVVLALQTIAHMGVTSAAVVHQPSHRISCLFDDLLLLGNGGTTVYTGPRDQARLYFEGIGFTFPSEANPSDVFMDIITGQHERGENPESAAEDLFMSWQASTMRCEQFTDPDAEKILFAQMQNNGLSGNRDLDRRRSVDLEHLNDGHCMMLYRFPVAARMLVSRWNTAAIEFCKQLSATASRFRGTILGENTNGEINTSRRLALKRKTPGFALQLYWCLGRICVQKLRNPLGVLLELSLFSLTGMALGFLADSRDTPGLNPIEIDMMHYFIGIGLLACVSSLRTFGLGKPIFFRESSCGINRLSFFMAHDIFDISSNLIFSLCISSLYCTFAQPQRAYTRMYCVVVSLMYAWTGLGYCLSLVMSYSSAQLTSAVLVLFDTLVSRQSFATGPFTRSIRLLSFSRWANQCVIIIEALKLEGVWLLERCFTLNNFDFPVSSFTPSLLIILALGFGTRIIACGMLFVVDKDKQQ